jgi:hypothetical protein
MNEIGSFVHDQIALKPNFQLSLGLRYCWKTYFKSIHDFAPRMSAAYSLPTNMVQQASDTHLPYFIDFSAGAER